MTFLYGVTLFVAMFSELLGILRTKDVTIAARGYTSLIDLCNFPIDKLKRDKNIMDSSSSSSDKGKHLLEGVVRLAEHLHIEVLCAGVETEEENAFVKRVGVDYIQGYYYSVPLPQDEFLKMLSG
jgi:EAL domain-containing protein (putative c-di-GMP-specific phosphodiesterase class I)